MIKYCYLLKIKTKGHKINILIQIKGIEGYPFITRFKTSTPHKSHFTTRRIEGYPFITRFKTLNYYCKHINLLSIEGYPFITRFKTIS